MAIPSAAASRWLQRAPGALAALAITIGAASWSQPHVDGSDLWWHLASGQSIWQHGEIPLTDSFSHTANGRAWTNHSWLWGCIFWAAYDGHADLAAWLNLSLIAALFALIAWNARRVSRSWLAAGAATWLAAASCHWFLDVRPHIITLLFSALLLATLNWRRAPWLWPPLLALWANLHGGFIFGLGALGVHALLQSAQAIRAHAPLPWAIGLGVICAALAVGLNPWGFAIYEVPFQHIYYQSPFAELIEWRPVALSLDPASYAGRFWWMLVLTLVGVCSGRGTLFSFALASVSAAMAISARRFIPLFAISAAPLVAVGLAALFDSVRRRLPAASALRLESTVGGAGRHGARLDSTVGGAGRHGARIGWAASGAALGAALLLWSHVDFLPRPLQRWTSGESYPSGASAYLAAMPDPPKHLFNYYGWGGYLMLHAPRVPVFIDTRASTLYSDALAADYFSMLDAADGWSEKFSAYAVDAVLVPTHSRIAAALRKQRPAWRVAHVDPRSVLLFSPPGESQSELAPASELLPEGADLQLSRGFRLRQRGELAQAKSALVAAQRADPLQLFAYGELIFVASLQGDAEALNHWIEQALRVYPRRENPIWSFAEQAWSAMERCEQTRAALQQIRLGSPFLADEVREDIHTRLRELACSSAR